MSDSQCLSAENCLSALTSNFPDSGGWAVFRREIEAKLEAGLSVGSFNRGKAPSAGTRSSLCA
jgi:hypothetical protein